MDRRRDGWTRRLRGEVREARAREVLGRWRASGATQAQFCRSEGISRKTLGRWRREFREDGKGATGSAREARFVRVDLGERRAGEAFEVKLRSGVRVRVPLGFDAGDLERLLGVLEPSAC